MSGRAPSRPDESWADDDESELPVPEGELIADKYSVERIFASGGMGIVCLGRHVPLNQPVAIKFLAPVEPTSPPSPQAPKPDELHDDKPAESDQP